MRVVNLRMRDDDKEPDLHRKRILWFAYLHLFNSAGHHKRSDVRLAGTGPYLRGELRQRAEAQLAALLGRLDDLRFDDIRVRLFREQHDGVPSALSTSPTPDAVTGPSSALTG